MKELKLRSLNISERKYVNDPVRGRTTFSLKEDLYIKENYLKLPVKRIAKNLNRSFCGVTGRLKHYNLEIPKEIREQRKLDSQKNKGDAPFNKGMKQSDYMSVEAIERTKATRFKKGQIPHNAIDRENGEVVVRTTRRGTYVLKYQWIRLAAGHWKMLHHYVWEGVYGEIEPGQLIRFKDGNQMNCSIENLELIDMKTNMLMNSIQRYPDELQRSMRLLGKLNRTLKNI